MACNGYIKGGKVLAAYMKYTSYMKSAVIMHLTDCVMIVSVHGYLSWGDGW